jgi:hypothetical protein
VWCMLIKQWLENILKDVGVGIRRRVASDGMKMLRTFRPFVSVSTLIEHWLSELLGSALAS